MLETRPPFMFWAIAVVGVLWNFIGCWNYILQTNPEAVAQMPEVYRFVVENRPSWATGAFAISVYGGAVGCILMVLRRPVALALLIISLLGSIATFYFSFRVLGVEPATASALLMSIALVWFAQLATKRGWLR